MARRLRIGVPLLLVALGALGIWLIVTGSGQDASSTGPDRLPIGNTDMASVEELAAIEVPGGAQDFLTARLDDDTQLDVTFTIDPTDEAGFIDGSGFTEPVDGERVITHSSPLWDLNVDGTVRGVADTAGGVTRAVELLGEGERTRVRLVLTRAA
ncbi:MAG: hypothetical protein ACK5O2_13745 [Microthrixaceae bacterium]